MDVLWLILNVFICNIYISKVQADTTTGLGEKTVLEVPTPAQRMFRVIFLFRFYRGNLRKKQNLKQLKNKYLVFSRQENLTDLSEMRIL